MPSKSPSQVVFSQDMPGPSAQQLGRVAQPRGRENPMLPAAWLHICLWKRATSRSTMLVGRVETLPRVQRADSITLRSQRTQGATQDGV